MTSNSTGDSLSIFRYELKPGIYKIQNLFSQTYMDIHEHTKEVCCRPAANLGEGKGLWRINPLGAGYSVQRVEPGRPAEFCIPLHGLGDGAPPRLSIAPYPVAWRLEIVQDEAQRGLEYVRVCWGTTNIVWDLDGAGCSTNGTKVLVFQDTPPRGTWRIWKLIPVDVQGVQTPSQ